MTDLSGHQIVPARFGAAFRLERGQAIEILNIAGNQVVDTWAVSAAEPVQIMSMAQTRSVNSSIFARAGMMLMSDRRDPMLAFEADTSPGVHDMLLCACNAAIYRELGCTPDHRSCSQNFTEALAEQGKTLPFTPAPLNLFMNVPVAADGTIDRVPPTARPGDLVVLRAQMPLFVVLSACPQDVTPVNGASRSPADIAVRILD